MDKTERVISLFIMLLKSRDYIKIGNIAEKFGVSQRTAFRYIDTLSLYLPIEGRKGLYGGFRIMPEYRKELKTALLADMEEKNIYDRENELKKDAGCGACAVAGDNSRLVCARFI